MVQLHDTLRRYYRGIRSSPAAMKIMLAISVFGNLPRFARVVSGHHHDLVFFPRLRDVLKGTLWLFDKGFLDHKRLGRIAKASQFYLCPTRKNANPFVIEIDTGPAWLKKAIRRSPRKTRLRALLPKDKPVRHPITLEVELLAAGCRQIGVRERV